MELPPRGCDAPSQKVAAMPSSLEKPARPFGSCGGPGDAASPPRALRFGGSSRFHLARQTIAAAFLDSIPGFLRERQAFSTLRQLGLIFPEIE